MKLQLEIKDSNNENVIFGIDSQLNDFTISICQNNCMHFISIKLDDFMIIAEAVKTIADSGEYAEHFIKLIEKNKC